MNINQKKLNSFIQSNNNLNIIIDYCRHYISSNNINIYIVGGFVRDFINGNVNESIDLDLVVHGNIDDFANNMSSDLGIKLDKVHGFANYKLILNNSLSIDIAHSRKEIYLNPGSLPKWEKSNIQLDLYRRDFTINSIALEIQKSNLNLIDPLNGQKDLSEKIIRIIHNKSFIDDPTRIFRAIKYKTRLGFNYHSETKKYIQESAENINTLSKYRKFNEIVKLVKEKNINKILIESSLPIYKNMIFPKNFLNRIGFIHESFWNESTIYEKLFFALIDVDDELRLEMINNIGLSKKELKTLNSYFEVYRTLKSKKILDLKELNISKDFISNLYHCL